MADSLYEVLEYVSIENKLYRSNKMTHEVIDGVLHFMLQFDYRVIRQIEAATIMQTLTQEVDLKNG